MKEGNTDSLRSVLYQGIVRTVLRKRESRGDVTSIQALQHEKGSTRLPISYLLRTPHKMIPKGLIQKQGVNFMKIVHRHPQQMDDIQRSKILTRLYLTCISLLKRT